MRLPIAAFAAALAVTAAGAVQAENFTLDKSHTAITFQVDHLGWSFTQGRFTDFDADINFDQDDPAKSSVEFTISAPSIDTGWAKRDEHVRGADFLNVEKHPVITFTSTSVEMTGEETAKVTGDLTMNGQTHEETFDVTLRKIGNSPFGEKKLTAGFMAESVIDRTKYGISYGEGAIGNEIPVRVDLEIVKDG